MRFRLSQTTPFTGPLSPSLLILSIVCAGLLGIKLLPAQEKTAAKNEAGQETREMQIQIRDENGKPLEGAQLHANISYFEDYQGPRLPKSDFVTGSTGMVKLTIPRRLRFLRLWAEKKDYVPEFVNFAQGTHDEGKLIPSQFEFRLERGTRMSGIVVDENGVPIPDVAVDITALKNEPAWSLNPTPIVNLEVKAVTDKAGRWHITNAPAKRQKDDFEYILKLTHPHYLSDSKPGELQTQQKITTAMLRDGSARIVMRPGQTVKGTVINSAGKPVTKGIVIWHDQPYYGSAVNEAELDGQGRFTTVPLPPGKYPFTVVAPGLKPIRQILDVGKSMDEPAFSLEPGNTLTLKIVDPDGKPVPQAHVSVRKWRGVESLYNWRHPNVLNSRIPTHADKNGFYVWDWAPDDVVTYHVSARPFASKTVTLAARKTKHIIKLDRPLVATGKVTDAQTGTPVKHFRVIPVIEFRPAFLSTSYSETRPGKEGRYEINLNDGDYDRRHLIRIEADGYRSAISKKSFGLGEGSVTQNFSLEPAKPRTGQVVDASGQPVSGATVIVGSPSIVPMMQNGKLDGGGIPLETSAEGQFQIAATFEPVLIRVIHESGFAEVERQPDEALGTISIHPWAQVSGRLFQAGKPVANQWVLFKTVLDPQLGEPRFQDSYSTQTDAEGRFEFKRLPPVAGGVQALLGPWQDSPLTSSQSVSFNLQPGDHKQIDLGKQGTTITGTVVATGRGEAALNKNWSLNYLIRRDQGLPLPDIFPELSFDPQGPVQATWVLDPNFYRWLRSRQHYIVKLSPAGQLQIGGVPPGDYDLVLRLYEQPAGCLVEAIGSKVIPVTITSDEFKAGVKDLGSIEVPCRVGPRVGESMYAYEFTDTTGRQRRIHDMQGRYVLMHVWASWCVPCLRSLPDINATRTQLADKPITFVGLNIDQRPADGEILVEKNHWDWSQNYLGDDSDMARQLAISAVPIYFLIGPDGRLVASTNKWSEMKDHLEAALNQKHNAQ